MKPTCCNCKINKHNQHVVNLGNYGWVLCDCPCHMEAEMASTLIDQLKARLKRQQEAVERTKQDIAFLEKAITK